MHQDLKRRSVVSQKSISTTTNTTRSSRRSHIFDHESSLFISPALSAVSVPDDSRPVSALYLDFDDAACIERVDLWTRERWQGGAGFGVPMEDFEFSPVGVEFPPEARRPEVDPRVADLARASSSGHRRMPSDTLPAHMFVSPPPTSSGRDRDSIGSLLNDPFFQSLNPPSSPLLSPMNTSFPCPPPLQSRRRPQKSSSSQPSMSRPSSARLPRSPPPPQNMPQLPMLPMLPSARYAPRMSQPPPAPARVPAPEPVEEEADLSLFFDEFDKLGLYPDDIEDVEGLPYVEEESALSPRDAGPQGRAFGFRDADIYGRRQLPRQPVRRVSEPAKYLPPVVSRPYSTAPNRRASQLPARRPSDNRRPEPVVAPTQEMSFLWE